MACVRIYKLNEMRDTPFSLHQVLSNDTTAFTSTFGAGSSTDPLQPREIPTCFTTTSLVSHDDAEEIILPGISISSEISSEAESKHEEDTDSSSQCPSESDSSNNGVPHSYYESDETSEPESILDELSESEPDNSESDHLEEIFDMLSSDVSDENDDS
jgi:hypothetical protein